MKKILKVLILVCLAWLMIGPVVGQEVTASAGGNFQGSGSRVDWTLGESAIQTFNDGSNIVTAGFHQPELMVTAVPDKSVASAFISVYPNPASDKITINFSNGPLPDATAKLYDSVGQLLSMDELISSESVISVATLPVGEYILNVTINNTENHQFKIIKSNK